MSLNTREAGAAGWQVTVPPEVALLSSPPGCDLCPRSAPSPLTEPRSYVESVVRTAVAGPRVQDAEPQSFSQEARLRNGSLGGTFVSPSPISTSSPILSADG